MGNLDREQLEALKRQIEEDYRLDIAAIERLLRRFMTSPTAVPTSSSAIGGDRSAVSTTERVATVERATGTDQNVTVLPVMESHPEPQQDELTNTLRGMFSTYRK